MINNSDGSKKAKILFVIPNLGKGGAEKVLAILLGNLDRKKIMASCIFYDLSHVYKVPDDVRIHSLDLMAGRSLQKKVINYTKGIFKIIHIINREKPDFVFSFLNRTNLLVIAARLLSSNFRNNIKLIISERTTPSVELKGGSSRFVRFLIKTMYPNSDRIVAVSRGVRDDLVNNFGLSEEKITVIYNPLDLKKIAELAGEEPEGYEWFNQNIPIVINVGSLSDPKSQDILLRAFKIVKERIECRLVLIGEGEKGEELKRLSQELDINNDVLFPGFQDNPFKFLSRSSVFVLSSKFEGFPNVLTEAMACGIPVISTSCRSGPDEIITDTVDGMLVPVGDVEKLASAILKVLGDREMAASMGAAARASVAKYDIAKVIREYESLFVPELRHNS